MPIPKRLALLPAEYAAKAAGGVAATGALIGTSDTFSGKLVDGLYRGGELAAYTPVKLWSIGADMATKTGFELVGKYAPDIGRAFEGIGHFYVNATQEPVKTAAAAAALFLLGYAAGEGIRFYRTEGKGSHFREFVRGLGKKVFGWEDHN